MDCDLKPIGPDPEKDGQTLYLCQREECQRSYSSKWRAEQIHLVCRASTTPAMRQTRHGPGIRIQGTRRLNDFDVPGTNLGGIIEKRLGQKAIAGCGCKSMMARMNAWGVKGCREHFDEIVAWLVDVATKKDWLFQPEEGEEVAEEDIGKPVPQTVRTRFMRRIARVAAAVPGGASLVESQCRAMVELAIRRTERDILRYQRTRKDTSHGN